MIDDDVSSKTSSESGSGSGSESGSESESDSKSNRNKYGLKKSKCPMSIMGDLLDGGDSEEEEEGSEVSTDESGSIYESESD